MAGKNGNKKIIEQFLADGLNYIFGCPGTVEQGWLDELKEYPEMKYILNYQESVAVMMADGYARATQKPTLVQLHSSPGIGNGVGALYQAKRGHSPLIVIAGDAGVKYMNMDAQMAADLVAIMEPVTKFATCVYSPENVLRTLRRAIKISATPPMGPVYVCLPADVLDQVNNESIYPTSIPSTKVLPDNNYIKEIVKVLADSKSPVIFIGDGVAYSQAQNELTNVAELIGAEVYGVDSGEINMDTTHPLYMGSTGHMYGFQSLPVTQKGDAVLIVGTYMLPEVYPELGDIYNPDAKVIHIDLNAYEIAKNHRVDFSVVADPKLTLKAIGEELKAIMTTKQKTDSQKRLGIHKKQKQEKRKALSEKNLLRKNYLPLQPFVFMEELSKLVPDDVMIFDEALTVSPDVTEYLPPKYSGHFFQTRGGSLGTGFPGAVGVKLAHPDKSVVGFSGDGGSLFTFQALATAAKYNIAAKFIVCNNHSYKLLELNLDEYRQEHGLPDSPYPEGFFLDNPDIRFDKLAESMGVPGERVEKHEEIIPAIKKMLNTSGPFLIDLVISNQKAQS